MTPVICMQAMHGQHNKPQKALLVFSQRTPPRPVQINPAQPSTPSLQVRAEGNESSLRYVSSQHVPMPATGHNSCAQAITVLPPVDAVFTLHNRVGNLSNRSGTRISSTNLAGTQPLANPPRSQKGVPVGVMLKHHLQPASPSKPPTFQIRPSPSHPPLLANKHML
jgi:hypothetical protein